MQPPKDKRRTVALPATIHRGDGQSPLECTVLGISDSRARFLVQDAYLVPDGFILSLGGAKVRRRCVLISRDPSEIFAEITKDH
jgi:hypothetical protein